MGDSQGTVPLTWLLGLLTAHRFRVEIWKDLCFRDYYLTAVKRYSPDVIPVEPDSWRARYFVRHGRPSFRSAYLLTRISVQEIQDAEARRMDELGTKLRLQSQEADQRKRQREIKFTDRVPQPKRFKGGCKQAFFLVCLSLGLP